MEFEELLDNICQAKDRDFPFALYRKPQSNQIEAIIQNDHQLEYALDFKESGFVMAPFNFSNDAVLFREDNSKRLSCRYFSEELPEFEVSTTIKKEIIQTDAKEKHMELVSKGISGIRKGNFEKVVLSRSEGVPLDTFDIPGLFSRMLASYPSAFVYIWFHPQIGLWAGASPETLLKTQGREIRTMSLAGTQKFKGSLEVSWGQKEIREQQIVTAHIIESMEGISLDIGKTYTKKAGNLLHLCNDIVGTLDVESNLSELIAKLHPTAAVCGFPKEKVREFILKNEGYNRSYYTGFIGELNRRGSGIDEMSLSSHLFVNLRCMKILEKPSLKALLYVGGGITAASLPESEWEETVQKSKVMKSVL